MRKSKRIFFLAGAVFFMLLLYASYDIATRTTFPGGKPQLKERIEKKFSEPDSSKMDSINRIKAPVKP